MTQTRTPAVSFRDAPDAPAVDAPRPLAPQCATARPQFVIATISPLVGDTGVQTHTRSLHDGLIDKGKSCAIQTPFDSQFWWLAVFGVRKIFGSINPSWSTRWYRRWHGAALANALMRQIGRNGADAVLAQCPVSAAVALNVRDRLGLRFPVVMACHFNYSEAKEYRDKGELADEASYQQILDLEKYVLGAVDRVVYVSGWAQRIVEQERGIKVRASSVIWNGIAANIGDEPLSRRQLDLAPDDLVLINVGTLEERKNQVGLVELFAEVAKEWPKAKLLLVGDGPRHADVRRRIDELNLAPKVRMLGTRRDVPRLLGAADMYVHYSAIENCPVVLIEAGRAALPMAAVPGGGVPELLDALGGFALNSASHAESMNTLRPLLNDAALRKQAGQNSREAFKRSFTREAMVDAYVKALQPASSQTSEVHP